MSIKNLPAFSPFIKQAIKHFGTIEKNPLGKIEARSLKLGNVKFWIDSQGPWKGELAYSIPTSDWDIAAIVSAIVDSEKLITMTSLATLNSMSEGE